MDSNAFTQLALIELTSPCRLLVSACCPDKDLVVLTSHHGGRARLSLWKMQGSKKWEVEIGQDSATDVVAIAWSPGGQTIAVAHNPPRVTLHSIQDGSIERSLLVPRSSGALETDSRVTGAWWFQDKRKGTSNNLPDLFKRKNDITGSAHSILKTQPLLDPLQDESQKLTATDLFAFQGTQTRPKQQSAVPEIIETWPILPSDPEAASIGSSQPTGAGTTERFDDDAEDPNVNSLLIIADDQGCVHPYLDGSYPLGIVELGMPGSQARVSVVSVIEGEMDVSIGQMYISPTIQVRDADNVSTQISPERLALPLLDTRKVRDLARLSSSMHELVWYCMRVVKEMRDVWFGTATLTGAREFGPRWIGALETKLKDQYGKSNPNGLLELTHFLVTGKMSEGLADFMGSGDQMSERGLQKWQNTVIDAHTKLRDCAEKRLAPACQRIHIILHEIQGWSLLPFYGMFEISYEEVTRCIEATNRAIFLAGWLASVARKDVSHFKHLMLFLRYQTALSAIDKDTPRPQPEYDLLQVNEYFTSGLAESLVDKWFTGPVPYFTPLDIGAAPSDQRDLDEVLARAMATAKDPKAMQWRSKMTYRDISHLDKNLEALIDDIGSRCYNIFKSAAGATTRCALLSYLPAEIISKPGYPKDGPARAVNVDGPERTTSDGSIFWLVHLRSNPSQFCIIQQSFAVGGQKDNASTWWMTRSFHCAIMDASIVNGSSTQDLNIMSFDFFDDETIVCIYRIRGQDKQTYIATFQFRAIEYQCIKTEQANEPVGYFSREAMVSNILELCEYGKLVSTVIPFGHVRELALCRGDVVSMAVNGRVGRRVACVLDGWGTSMEVFDMDSQDDEMEEGFSESL